MKTQAIEKAEILLPKGCDLKAYAVIACDQFTSEKEYWNDLEKYVGDKISTLNLILPEIYLNGDFEKRIEKINSNIIKYLNDGVFAEYKDCFILTVRKTQFVERRIGLVGKVDLDKYEYGKKTSSLVRATEGTIEERIPPRLKIRKDAPMEFTHAMILFDDEKREITEKLYSERAKYKMVYDFELNMGGGHIEGYLIDGKDAKKVLKQFGKLLDKKRLTAKYGKDDKFLFAVGDGNHSLATAKTHWENVKKTLSEKEIKTHPAKYALAEFVNIYDEGIYFEPIFRFVKGVDRAKFIKGLKEVKGDFKIYDGKTEQVSVGTEIPASITAVDEYIKGYMAENGGNVDYVHGEQNLSKLVDGDKTSVGILFEKIKKEDLFKYVSNFGAFPRKTFSMGEGVEKRYYLEGRKIK